LAWELRYPPDERLRIEREAQIRRQHKRPPLKVTLTEPDPLHEDLQDVWQCWWSMNGRRQAGFSLCALPLTEIVAELDERGLRGATRARWRRLLDAMESAYLEHVRSRHGSS